MPYDSWAAMLGASCVNWGQLDQAAAAGAIYKTSSFPTLIVVGEDEFCPDRAEIEDAVYMDDMSASGIAADRLLTKDQVLAWANSGPGTSGHTHNGVWTLPPTTWESSITYDVNPLTQSVRYRSRVDGGAWGSYTTQDVAPSQQDVTTIARPVAGGSTIEWEFTAYTGDGATGTPSDPRIVGPYASPA